MNLTKLISLYPDAQKKTFPSSDEKILSLAVDDSFLWIKKSVLYLQEIKILKALFPVSAIGKNHPWYHYLFENQPFQLESSFRIIQLRIEPRGDFLKREWQETIHELFQLEDFFFYTETDALLIEKKHISYFDAPDLKGIFFSLDADFDLTTQVFVGTFHLPTQDFFPIFRRKKDIFRGKKIFCFTWWYDIFT